VCITGFEVENGGTKTFRNFHGGTLKFNGVCMVHTG
jgi:hypothetical protein